MIKRLLGYLLLIAVALPASAAFDIGQLMGDLARHKGGKAKFVEKKYFAILDKPVISTGEMTYTAPDRLEKRTLTPKVETLLLDKDILSIERDKQSCPSTWPTNRKRWLSSIASAARCPATGRRWRRTTPCTWPAMPTSGCSRCSQRPENRQPGAAHHGQRQQEPGTRHRIPAGRRRPLGAQHRPVDAK